MASSRLLAATVLASAWALEPTALAEPTAAERATARGLMSEGRADRERGDLQGAVKAFAGADAIMHVPTTGIELARARAAVGLLVEARDTAMRVTRIPEGESEPPPFRAAREAAAALGSELDRRIPSVTIAVSGPSASAPAQVTLDGLALPAEQLGQPRKVNPGHHSVDATAAGEAYGTTRSQAHQEVDLAEGESKTVSLRVAGPEAAADPGTQPSEQAEDNEPEKQPEQAPSQPAPLSRAMVVGGFGVAGAGVVLGTVTGILALTATTSIKSSGHCYVNTCGPEEYDRIQSANTMAMISTVSFVAAGAGAVAGLVGLFLPGTGNPPTRAPSDDSTTSRSRVEPWVGIGSLGVRGRF